MLKYCIQDVKVNVEIYNKLLEEYKKIHAKNPLIKIGLKVEHDMAVFNVRVREEGWNFDLERARETQRRMLERMKVIEDTIEPQLGERCIWIDKEEKLPKFTKNGNYTSATARMLSEFYNRQIGVEDLSLIHISEPTRPY